MPNYKKLIKGIEEEFQTFVERNNSLLKQRQRIADAANAEIQKINEQIALNEAAKLRLQGKAQGYEELKNKKQEPKKTIPKKKKKSLPIPAFCMRLMHWEQCSALLSRVFS